MVRGDFGFTHDKLFVGYRHEHNVDGDKKGMALSMGAASFKTNDALIYARSDMVNKFFNLGVDYTHKDFGLTVEGFMGMPYEKLSEEDTAAGKAQQSHPGSKLINENIWLKSCFTMMLGASPFKWRLNLGGVGTGGCMDSYVELKHKINDNLTVGVNHKYHEKLHGQTHAKETVGRFSVSRPKHTDIGITAAYKI